MKNNYFEQIEPYLDGSLDLEQRIAFEQQLEQDEALQQEVSFQQQMIQGLKMAQQDIDKKQLLDIWEGIKHQPQIISLATNRRILLLGLALAASVLILFLFWWSNQQPHQLNWKQQYFEPYAMQILRAGEQQPVDQQLGVIRLNYEAGNFDQTIALLKQLPKDSVRAEDITFYTGVSYLGMDSLNAATKAFEELLTSNNRWDEHARWYLIITALEQGKTTQALVLLQEIQAQDRHYRKGEALEILKRLQN